VHGSADASGATPIAMLRPIAAADATDTDAIRGRGDMFHLLWADVALTSAVG
jgi:hypothetical protein